MIILYLFIALFAAATPSPLQWEWKAKQKRVSLYKEDVLILHFWVRDNRSSGAFGQLTDSDPRENHLLVTLPKLQLETGHYTLSDGQENRALQISPPSQASAVQLPSSARGVLAYRSNAVSYASNQSGVAFLPLENLDGWERIPLEASQGFESNRGVPNGIDSFTTRPKPKERKPSRQSTLGLLMVSLVSVLLFSRLFKRTSRRGVLLSILVGFLIIQSTLSVDDIRLLVSGVGFDDPPTSTTLLDAIATDITSSNTQTFSFPEGHSWLIMGPSWLAYVITAPICWMFNAVQAYNIGIALYCALLFWGLLTYTKSLGLSRQACFFAASGGVFAPVILNELDKLSLDRAFLFPLPLLLLCLTRSKRHYFWAGVGSLALLFYGQFYYGIFLGAALPFLLLSRLKLRNIGIGVLALILMLPGLWMLLESSSGTVYDGAPFRFDNIWEPLERDEIKTYIGRFDPRYGAGEGDRPMNTAEEQLLASIVNSVQLKDIIMPSVYFCGQSLYWVWILLALIFSPFKGSVLRTSWDVFVLSIFSLGPFLRELHQD